MLNIYRASAGSGKTFQLTKDYISLLFDAYLKANNPRPHRRILAVTFTNKATDEMKSRIMKELHLLATGADSPYRADLMEVHSKPANEINSTAKSILNGILHDYSFFSISTIDKFFLQIIRSFAREIGVSGGYNVELDNQMTLQQALDNMYASLSDKENKNLLNWMTGFLQEQIESGNSRYVDRAILSFGQELFKENYQHKAREVKELLDDKKFLNDYRAKLWKSIESFKQDVSKQADSALKVLTDNGIEPEFFSRKMMFSTLEGFKNEVFDYGSTYEKYLESSDKCYTKATAAHLKNTFDEIYYSGFQDILLELDKTIQAGLPYYNSAQLILRNIDTLGILADLAEHIQQITTEKNVMLLSDSNMLLNQIIDGSDTPFVYERTGLNIDHYMIDEFQDTSALQWENFKPLIANSLANGDKTNMLVGDVKQSIYRWRNSDWKLLAEQAENDFKNQNINKHTLETNWRSDRNIIEFNNNLFEASADLLQTKFNNELASSSLENKHNNKIKTAYDDIKQLPAKKAGEGYVRVEFVENSNRNINEWRENILSRIPQLVESLVDNGYKNSDIAFLVRTNSEAKLITEFMLNYASSADRKEGFSYLVVGNEGLMLSASISINFIISVLSYILDPNDDVARTNILYEYQLAKNKRAGNSIPVLFDKEVDFSTYFSAKENACLSEIIHLSLFEAVENLISTFDMESWYGETIFLQAFQDVVFKYSNNNNADLNSFVKWWKDEGKKQRINIPENEHAFRVMTVHASKGLAFKVVIMPFCNWGLKSSAQRAPLLWCETDVAPFSELPLLPVKFGSNLANSIFSEDYFDELLHQYVDNLNIGYVGFTRAENEIYLFSEGPAKNADNLNYFSDLMYKSITENSALSEFWNEEEGVLEIGKPTEAVYKEEESTEISIKQTSYPIEDSSNRLRIKHTSKDYWKSKPISESKVNYGTLMHEILQKTIRRGDEEKTIAEFLSAGKINKNDLPEIQAEFKLFWSNEEAVSWFTEGKEVLNENPILLPDGGMYRPDRVILEGNKATVIDYKFGEEEKNFYNRQMQNYTNFLKEMGYENVEGKIYYVKLGKVDAI